MLQTRRRAARLLQRPHTFQLRGYVDIKPGDPMDSNRGNADKPVNEPLDGGDSSGTPSKHAASAGHHGSTYHDAHPAPANESIGSGLYIAIAVLVGSVAFYKWSRSSTDSGDVGNQAKQPLITRFLHRFDYFAEQNATRNALFTGMLQQAGHDRNLFRGSPASQHVDLKFPEIFNTGSPWNVPAGHSANLDDLREHYRNKNAEEEEKRRERLEWTAQDAESRKPTEGVKETFGKTVNAVSRVGKKAEGQ